LKPLVDVITALVAPAVEAAGLELVRVQITGKQALTVQIMAERADRTMTAEDCASLSRALSVILDEADPIAGSYTLEVSSPGIDRPLTRLKDFHDWQGYEARIDLAQPMEGRKRFAGVLAGVDGDNVCLNLEGEDETALIPFALIARAKLILTDALIRESLNASKRAAQDAADHPNNDDATGDAA
jgi:ribosome maturation factor RimP